MSAAVQQGLRSDRRNDFSPPGCRWLVSLLALATLGASSEVRADEAAVKSAGVKVVRNLAYYEGADADPVKHRLDLYLPRGQKGFPVLLFVHGGAWQVGDKNQFGLYAALGRRLARHGIGMVSINYRLSPGVKHPEHIKDDDDDVNRRKDGIFHILNRLTGVAFRLQVIL